MKELMRRIRPKLKRVYVKISAPPVPNNAGAREIEYSWIFANIPNEGGSALDLGTGNSYTGLLAARKGYEVLGIDLRDTHFNYHHPRFKFRKEDFFNLELEPNSLDLVINCSTIEHIGLKGRYNVKEEQSNGDLDAMRLLRTFIKKNKIMLMTIPVGKDALFHPYHRVYGSKRLPKLLENWEIEKEEFWLKNEANQWIQKAKEEVINMETNRYYYGLGLFVLSA